MASHTGLERTAGGGTKTVAAVPDEKCGGVGRKGGALAVLSVAAAAIPAGAIRRDGVAFDANGRLCTTTSGAGCTLQGGLLVRSDGAVVVVATAPTAASRMVNTPFGSFMVDANGAIHTG